MLGFVGGYVLITIVFFYIGRRCYMQIKKKYKGEDEEEENENENEEGADEEEDNEESLSVEDVDNKERWLKATRQEISRVLQDDDRIEFKPETNDIEWKEALKISIGVTFLEALLCWPIFLGVGLTFAINPFWALGAFLLFVVGFVFWVYFDRKITIPPVHKGELTFRNKRIKKVLDEGDYWLPPGFGIKTISMKEKTLEIKSRQVKSFDGVRVDLDMEVQYKPINVHAYLDVEDHETLLGNFIRSVNRSVIASNTGKELQTGEGGKFIYRRTTFAIVSTSEEDERGLIINTVDIADVTLPEPIEEAQEKKQEKKNQLRANDLEIAFINDKIRAVKDEFGFPAKQASNYVLTVLGYIELKGYNVDVDLNNKTLNKVGNFLGLGGIENDN